MNNDHYSVSASNADQQYSYTKVYEPQPNDVICGRGGHTNVHPGNVLWRREILLKQTKYLSLRTRREKSALSQQIVNFVRDQKPPGRFLKLDDNSGLWHDIGDIEARKKTQQALREGAPELRQKILNNNIDKLMEPIKENFSSTHELPSKVPHIITCNQHDMGFCESSETESDKLNTNTRKFDRVDSDLDSSSHSNELHALLLDEMLSVSFLSLSLKSSKKGLQSLKHEQCDMSCDMQSIASMSITSRASMDCGSLVLNTKEMLHMILDGL